VEISNEKDILIRECEYDIPFFSIIIPVYKVEQYLRCCLDSVLRQTFIKFECILVDDGSPDDCPAICDEYAKKDSRFKVIHKENGGLSDARNVGIRMSIGDYTVLLDSDDLFANNKALESLYKMIEETKADVIFNSNLTILSSETVTSSDGFKKEFICGDPIQFYLNIIDNRKIILAGCLFTVQRSFLLHNDLFFKIGILHEDMPWIACLICAASKIGVNHNLFYMVREGRPGSITTTIYPKRLFDEIATIEDMLDWLKTENRKAYICQMVYKDICTIMWKYIFCRLFLLVPNYRQESIILLKRLKNVSYVLLYRFSLRNVLCYSLIHFSNGNIKKYFYSFKIVKLLQKIEKFFINVLCL
jgi:glycosyltransferase involved in cell wall biosynthesis